MRGSSPPGGIELERGGSLLERAAALLGEGPLPTSGVAARALGISGDPCAAALAVWSLLGDDPRFEVSPDGIWSLRAAPPPPCFLRDEEWVVVDVETTGGSPAAGHRVTEVAAVRVSEGAIRDVFSTLVNPQRPIPGMISALTGITNQMVARAPIFSEVAPGLTNVLRGHVFVAHNAAFDWRFVTAEMERSTGHVLAGRQLCTVRLSRKLLPQLPSRSLGPLALYFGLEIASRHRAEDDAVATAHLLLRLVDMLEERGITQWTELEALLGARAPRRKRTHLPRSMDSA